MNGTSVDVYVSNEDPERDEEVLGNWRFVALPRVGDLIAYLKAPRTGRRFRVVSVMHYLSSNNKYPDSAYLLVDELPELEDV